MSETLPGRSSFPLLDSATSGVVSTVLYFDIFNYPLTLDEIKYNCHHTLTTPEAVEQAVRWLLEKNMLFEKKGFYFFSGRSELIERRVAGNALSEKFRKKAKRFSSLISQFPFVRCVCISGSLSKGYMDPDSDVDYFIVTQPGRLWVCRTLLVLFKKMFLLNSKKYFCVNYFVDENSLVIPDKNIFTATELSFVLPMYNYELYQRMVMENSWCREFYPNKKIARDASNIEFRNGLLKRLGECLLSGRLGEKLDAYFFRLTLRYWKKKFSHFDETAFDLNLRSRRHVSKHHPQGFQHRVLAGFEEKKRAYEQQFKVSLAG